VPIELLGNWTKGRAYALHTLASTYLGVNEYGRADFDTTYSDMGELIRQLKYRNDKSALPNIIALLDNIKGIETFDYFIPVPSSNKSRPFQPVYEIAEALGKHREVEVLTAFLEKKAGGPELKNVDDPEERKALMKDALYINSKKDISGKSVLLVDDLYRSGTTLMAATELLLEKAEVRKVCVLTMTKTRSNR